MQEGFRQKNEEELTEQTDRVSEELGQEIVQPSRRERVFDMPIEEIKEKFPRRYEMYLKTLRAEKSGEALSETKKAEMSQWLEVLNNLDNYIENHWVNGERTLREKQINVFEDIRDFFEKGGKDGYIKLPTGAGKTVIFSELVEAMGLKTLIAVPTKILVGQTEKKLSQFAGDLDVGKIYADAKEHGDDVTIITYQSLVSGIEKGTINPAEFGCLILDEAHASLSDRRVEAVDKFKHAVRLGFTATPQYSRTKHVGQILENEIHNLGIREAAEEGVISPFSVILAETDVDISNIQVKSNGEFDEADLQRAINTEARNNSAVDLYKKMFKGQSAVAYCSGVEHAKNLAQIFNDRGLRAAFISGKHSQKEQEKILEMFHSGEVDVLCNSDILIAGFDEQKASVCLNLRPTLSPVVAEQRGGRVLRLNEGDPNKHATIVDFIDKNENKRVHPITFAEIAGASVVLPARSSGGKGGNGGGPENPKIEVEGLQVITDPKEVMRIVKQKIEGELKDAPENWLTKDTMARQINSTYVTIQAIAERYREEHPEWFQIYKGKNGVATEHISPELVEKIIEEMPREAVPEGWITRNALTDQTGRGASFIDKLVENYKNKHPKWVRPYMTKKGRVEYISPELAKIIMEEHAYKAAPEGWMHAFMTAEKIGLDYATVKKAVEKYRAEHPEWFEYYTTKKGNTEHYSPELIERIITDEVHEVAPEGWVLRNDLALQLNRDSMTIKSIAQKYKKDHPEWFHQFKTKRSKKPTEHYSLELVEHIKADAEKLVRRRRKNK